ncbi:MAG: tetratricopeptide repeat protein [Proteobacteria bacterium]|nr:tetratricopeptide repeat protein [Pseudomonadota bacterium]
MLASIPVWQHTLWREALRRQGPAGCPLHHGHADHHGRTDARTPVRPGLVLYIQVVLGGIADWRRDQRDIWPRLVGAQPVRVVDARLLTLALALAWSALGCSCEQASEATTRPQSSQSNRQPAKLHGPQPAAAVRSVHSATPGGEQGLGKQGAQPSSASPQYVGRGVCSRCHRAAFEAWSGSHHDLAMQRATHTTVLGDFANRRFSHFGQTMLLNKTADGRFTVRTRDGKGRPHDYTVSHTFGVAPLQQYLVETEPGRLQALQVAWDSRPKAQGGQRWFHLYPDDPVPPGDALYWTGPAFNWNSICADCHATGVRRGYDRETARYETEMHEQDVGCEACHGPGSKHVDWASRGAAPQKDAGTKGLVHALTKPRSRRWTFVDAASIASLSGGSRRDPELEACAPCHSRRADLGPGKGTSYHDRYRLELLEEQLYFPDGQARSEVYVYGSFLQSRMWAKGVVCSDCHEPHSLEPRDEGNALCSRCHRADVYDVPKHHFHPPASRGAQCVACHMPQRTYMVVDRRRDHRLGVPQPLLSAKTGAPDVCTGCHKKRTARWADAQIARRFERRKPSPHALALWRAQTQQQGAHAGLLASFADTDATPMLRASALAHLGRTPSSRVPEALARAATDRSPLVRRAAAMLAAAVPPEARRVIAQLLADPVRSVRIEAASAFRGADTTRWPGPVRGHLEQALAEYRASRLFSVDRAESLVELAYLEQAGGRFERARALLREALARDPTCTPAYINLADLLRAAGNAAECEKLLREGLRRAGSKPVVHHALGLALTRQQRPREALKHLKAAYELQPSDAHAGYVYAVALFDSGDKAGAYRLLQRLHRRFGTNVEVLSALVSYAQLLGRGDASARYREKLRSLSR